MPWILAIASSLYYPLELVRTEFLFLQPVDFVIKKEWLANCEQFHVSVSQEGELQQQRVCVLYTQESNISEVILFKSKITPPSTIILDHVEIETCS